MKTDFWWELAIINENGDELTIAEPFGNIVDAIKALIKCDNITAVINMWCGNKEHPIETNQRIKKTDVGDTILHINKACWAWDVCEGNNSKNCLGCSKWGM